MRTFTTAKARREKSPLLISLIGASSSGKTFSALRLATGIQRVDKRRIYVIDTEARRSTHYAGIFDFEHLDFKAPFGPLDYLAAVDHCVGKGAGTIIIDSASHWHEGPGGILDMHAQSVERMSKGDEKKADRVNMIAWAKPKQELQRLLNSIVQTGCSMILCFRAKEKIKPRKGGEPEEMGWMPIASPEAIFEMTVSAILPPNSGGVPDWNPQRPGERAMSKLPIQFHKLREKQGPLDEEVGEKMATWASGASVQKEVS